MANYSSSHQKGKGRRPSLTQFLPKNNGIIYNPYNHQQNSNNGSNNGSNNNSRSQSPPGAYLPTAILTSASSAASNYTNSSVASPRTHANYNHYGNNLTNNNTNNNSQPPYHALNRAKSHHSSGVSFNKYIYTKNNTTDSGTPKPDFLVKRRSKLRSHSHKNDNGTHNNNQPRRRIFSNGYNNNNNNNNNGSNKNGYFTSPEYDGNESATDINTDVDTETDTEISFDALKYAATNGQQNGGYLSDGTALANAKNDKNHLYNQRHSTKPKLNGHHGNSNGIRRKKRIKSFKRSFSPSPSPSPAIGVNGRPQTMESDHMSSPKLRATSKSFNIGASSVEKFRGTGISTNIDRHSTKEAITKSIDKFNRKKRRGKYNKNKKKYKEDIAKKRHSVGHTDSLTLSMMKGRYDSNGERKKKLSEHGHVKWHRSTSVEKGGGKTKKEQRRRSLFNTDETATTTPLDRITHDNTAFDTINSQKWDVEQLLNIETEQEFHHELDQHSKEDIIELCWDLLRSKDKSDDLLRMVSVMNTDLDQEKAYDTMMKTIKQTLDCKFASLYAREEESTYLKCLWTSKGEPEKELFISITNSTQLPSRVFHKNDSITRSLTENNEQICPDFDGFGNVYVMGVPIRDHSNNNEKIGVLMVYRDRSKSDMFDDRDLHSAELLCSITATTLRNVSLYNATNEKEKQSQKILSIIDEMSGDVSQGYRNIIKKLVRRIRSLVACTHIHFWTIDFIKNKLICEVSHSHKLQDIAIDRDMSTVIGQCAITGKCIKIDNSRLDKRWNDQQLKYSQGESVMIIPVRVEQDTNVIAVIVAIDKVPKMKKLIKSQKLQCIPFTNEDRRMMETFATSASVIIKNSLLFQKINGLNRKHESMVSILRALQEKHNVTHMLSEATLAVREALEAERVSLWFEDGQGNLDALDIGDVDSFGNNHDYDDSKNNDQNSTQAIQSVFVAIARYCAEDKMLINTPNVFEDEELWNAITDFIEFKEISGLDENHWFLRRACSVLCVPILSNDSVVGVIQAIYKKGNNIFGFTDTDQQIVESVSSEVAHTIARNISDLTLQKYVDKHDDIPLDVIEYYLTGSLMTNNTGKRPSIDHRYQESMDSYIDEENENEYIGNFKEQQQMIRARSETPQPFLDSNGTNIYTKFILDAKLKSYCEILPTCDFDATAFDVQQDLEAFVMFAIDESGLIQEFKLNIPKLTKFIHSIAKLYRTNPFHNWQHGFFVFHFVLYFIKKQSNISQVLSKQELLAILIAGLCHDVDHPGNDNLYEIEAETDLARIYNTLSVLENHHTYTTLALLRKNELNFFQGSNLNQKDIKFIKKIIIKSIMATDMTHHSEAIGWLNDFVTEKVVETTLKDPKLKDMKKNEIKTKICQCIVHMGDLSAQTYPWRIAKEWERRIAREFKQQTIKETKLGIPVRDWMAKTDLTTRYKNQFFFVTHVVKPLWEPAAALFPEMEERLSTLKSNSAKYIEIANKKATKD